jgi:hypothetical protein
MTRRERLERRAERREEWAEKAGNRAADKLRRAGELSDQIPMGQPILVGHHSEKRHRRHVERIDANMRKGIEEERKSEHHASKADGLRNQMDRSIYSDDPDAIEQLEARILELERSRDRMKATNQAWRKAGKPGPEDSVGWTKVAAALGWTEASTTEAKLRRDLAQFPYHKQPYPSYALTNLGGNIRRLRKRIDDVKARQARSEAAESADGPVIDGETWVSVTFPEKPGRDILQALKAAGFLWKAGSWWGERAKLPVRLHMDQAHREELGGAS